MSRFFRTIKEGFLGVKRHGAMSFSSASAVTMTLLIIGAFIIINANIQHMVDNIEGDIQITVKIEHDTDENGIATLRREIAAIPEVSDIVFSSKDDELQAVTESFSEDSRELFKRYVGDSNPLYDVFFVSVSDSNQIETVTEQIRQLNNVNKALYGEETTLKMIAFMEQLRRVGYIAVAALTVIAVLLISNTINTTINARKDEIFIMRTVGASNGFIRGPFLVEGIVIGLLGSILPAIALCGGYYLLYDYIGESLGMTMFSLVEPLSLIQYLAAIIVGAGILVGAFGSLLSVNRKLWWKR